ncbi:MULTISPECIES: AMP-binding protein [Micrococcaceae]|uniref:AMP-binding protein n=1 Tax=Micrococcaceae TaxID=1268 RepID=UPI00180E17CF|nr:MULTISPECIES: AMP-binding protein [Micrococcaceae]MBB5750478.1 acetyl-CoA synthetase [Micrococcus sp. TA1]HRO28915.1 AMP-binding protein [Citricoccus sp.]HRO94090.1 AMP-binding protein [Citricoccus sp.]
MSVAPHAAPTATARDTPAHAPGALPGPLPADVVDAADPSVHPGRPAGLLHGGLGDGRPVREEDRLAFWDAAARRLEWETPWHTTHSWTPADPAAERGPEIRWFEGGRLNVAVNCVDRHVAAGRGEKVALYFEGEPGDRRAVTYAQLQRKVSQAANALLELGIGKGDRVVVYLPVLVETIVITLACARIGAVHSLVFGGFSAEALRFRVEDTGAKLLVTSEGQYRRGQAVPVKDNADEAVSGQNQIEHVLVLNRTGHTEVGDGPGQISWTEGRDVWWHEIVDRQPETHTPEYFDAETPLFIMYTSGTTGQPKGLVHTSGGYLTQASWSYDYLFSHPDVSEREKDVHWCTADLAWVTAHTYEIYGPLSNGVTEVIYEGVPNAPHPGRHFEVIERYGVTSYYTAPTLVRSLMGWFPEGIPAGHDLSSIRLVGTVGEAVNPEAWTWARTQIGRSHLDALDARLQAETGDDDARVPRDGSVGVPMVDTWWQSETGATVLSPRQADERFKPGCGSRPLPGVDVAVVDDAGAPVAAGLQGKVVVTRTGPAMARTVWGNPRRYFTSYWKDYAGQGWFLAGDGAKVDEDGDTWILGRIDDVINISGHRLSTIEIESALVSHPEVVEAGVCPVPDAKTGHAAVAFVVARAGFGDAPAPAGTGAGPAADAAEELRRHVGRVIGPVAKPREVVFVPDVPKTRSGKIMRRLLTQLYEGTALGDTTSLQNEPCVGQIAEVMGRRPSHRPAAAQDG